MVFKNKNIYITGKVIGNNRTQNLVKFLLDQNANLYYNSFKINFFKNKKGFKRIVYSLIRRFDIFVKYIISFYNVMISDIVIFPAICHNYKFELKYAKFFNKIIITDFYISFYDTLVLDRATIPAGTREAKNLMKLDFNSVNKSDFSLFLNSTEAKYYLGLINIPFNSEKHLIVPLCIEETIKCNLNYYSEIQRDKVFNICWWGTYIPLHGLNNIIQAVEILNRTKKFRFHLYLFGTDEEKSKPYAELVKKLKIEHIVTIDNQSTFTNGKLSEFLESKCDLVLGNFGDSEKAKKVIVNKVIDGVAMKIPVLTGESIAPHEFFHNDTIFYSLNNPESIAQSIFNISQEKYVIINRRIERAYMVYRNSFSVQAFNKKLTYLFDKI